MLNLSAFWDESSLKIYYPSMNKPLLVASSQDDKALVFQIRVTKY